MRLNLQAPRADVHLMHDPERLLAIIRTQNEITSTALRLEEVMAVVVRRAQELTRAAGAVVELAERGEMVYVAASGIAEPHLGLRLPLDASLSGLCVTHDEVLYCADSQHDERVNAEACVRVGATSLLCVPLRHEERAVGVLKVYDPRSDAFSPGDADTLRLLSGVVAAHMAHAEDFQRQHQESRTDPLTGLLNRRALEERLGTELPRARRHGRPLSLCLLDLDGFKAVNDARGHDAGDALLRAVARHLDAVRGQDGGFRLGGDEFVLLLPEASAAGARAAVGRIEAAVRADPACGEIGLSWGIVEAEPTDSGESLLARADATMYRAKRAVRRGARESTGAERRSRAPAAARSRPAAA